MPWRKTGEFRAVDLVRHFQSGIDQKFIKPDERFVVMLKSDVIDVTPCPLTPDLLNGPSQVRWYSSEDMEAAYRQLGEPTDRPGEAGEANE